MNAARSATKARESGARDLRMLMDDVERLIHDAASSGASQQSVRQNRRGAGSAADPFHEARPRSPSQTPLHGPVRPGEPSGPVCFARRPSDHRSR